jgi:hypothetical protein
MGSKKRSCVADVVGGELWMEFDRGPVLGYWFFIFIFLF